VTNLAPESQNLLYELCELADNKFSGKRALVLFFWGFMKHTFFKCQTQLLVPILLVAGCTRASHQLQDIDSHVASTHHALSGGQGVSLKPYPELISVPAEPNLSPLDGPNLRPSSIDEPELLSTESIQSEKLNDMSEGTRAVFDHLDFLSLKINQKIYFQNAQSISSVQIDVKEAFCFIQTTKPLEKRELIFSFIVSHNQSIELYTHDFSTSIKCSKLEKGPWDLRDLQKIFKDFIQFKPLN
jgi:hypothetical protein